MSALESVSAVRALRDVLQNAPIRRIELAWTTSTAADWALLVVLLIVAYDAGGAVAAGVLGAVRVVPGIVVAPFSSSLVARFRGDRMLAMINVARSVGAVATAAVVATGIAVELVYVFAAVVAGAGSLVRPIQTALLPAFARTPRELVAANVATSMGEGVGTFVGPLLAGLLVAVTGSVAASLLVAAAFAGAAAAVTGIRFERAADARGGVAPSRRAPLVDGPRTVRRYPATMLLMGDFVAQIFVRGVLVTLIVVASIELLDLGDSGVGLLNAALGFGGFAGAVAALGLGGGRRLGVVCALALAGWGIPLVFIGVLPYATVAVIALFATGVSNALLDVSGFTLIQRDVSNEDRVAVFGLFEGLLGIGLLAGSLVAPLLLAVVEVRGAFIVAGAILPLLALLTWRPIVRNSRSSAISEDRLELLRRNPLFTPLPLTALDRLAESLVPVSFGAGETIMLKGEVGTHYVLIADGAVDVTDGERHLRTCGAGDGVGEIALLRRVPRTATVVAREPVSAYLIDAEDFLAAVAGPSAAAAAEAVASRRLEHSEAAPVSVE